ncbi:hypothetical protein, partial [Leisingera sp. F5]|uniref:hypothetical protein n=1 Tax=Leisingera sp. F5 TaxID=1813816 RepID=UPI0025C39D34
MIFEFISHLPLSGGCDEPRAFLYQIALVGSIIAPSLQLSIAAQWRLAGALDCGGETGPRRNSAQLWLPPLRGRAPGLPPPG